MFNLPDMNKMAQQAQKLQEKQDAYQLEVINLLKQISRDLQEIKTILRSK